VFVKAPRAGRFPSSVFPEPALGAPLDKIRESLIAEHHPGALMDVRITHTGSFTLYGDPAIVNL